MSAPFGFGSSFTPGNPPPSAFSLSFQSGGGGGENNNSGSSSSASGGLFSSSHSDVVSSTSSSSTLTKTSTTSDEDKNIKITFGVYCPVTRSLSKGLGDDFITLARLYEATTSRCLKHEDISVSTKGDSMEKPTLQINLHSSGSFVESMSDKHRSANITLNKIYSDGWMAPNFMSQYVAPKYTTAFSDYRFDHQEVPCAMQHDLQRDLNESYLPKDVITRIVPSGCVSLANLKNQAKVSHWTSLHIFDDEMAMKKWRKLLGCRAKFTAADCVSFPVGEKTRRTPLCCYNHEVTKDVFLKEPIDKILQSHKEKHLRECLGWTDQEIKTQTVRIAEWQARLMHTSVAFQKILEEKKQKPTPAQHPYFGAASYLNGDSWTSDEMERRMDRLEVNTTKELRESKKEVKDDVYWKQLQDRIKDMGRRYTFLGLSTREFLMYLEFGNEEYLKFVTTPPTPVLESILANNQVGLNQAEREQFETQVMPLCHWICHAIVKGNIQFFWPEGWQHSGLKKGTPGKESAKKGSASAKKKDASKTAKAKSKAKAKGKSKSKSKGSGGESGSNEAKSLLETLNDKKDAIDAEAQQVSKLEIVPDSFYRPVVHSRQPIIFIKLDDYPLIRERCILAAEQARQLNSGPMEVKASERVEGRGALLWLTLNEVKWSPDGRIPTFMLIGHGLNWLDAISALGIPAHELLAQFNYGPTTYKDLDNIAKTLYTTETIEYKDDQGQVVRTIQQLVPYWLSCWKQWSRMKHASSLQLPPPPQGNDGGDNHNNNNGNNGDGPANMDSRNNN